MKIHIDVRSPKLIVVQALATGEGIIGDFEQWMAPGDRLSLGKEHLTFEQLLEKGSGAITIT